MASVSLLPSIVASPAAVRARHGAAPSALRVAPPQHALRKGNLNLCTSRAHVRCSAARSRSEGTWKGEDLDVHTDYYEMLGVEEDASPAEIKKAYKSILRRLHPDVLDSHEEAAADAHTVAVELNRAVAVLCHPHGRAAYDSGRILFGAGSKFADYTGLPLSHNARPQEPEVVFVDENTCIGCMACKHEAPATFIIDKEYGRARVEMQWGDVGENIQAAVDACPVNCIHWVNKAALPVLEWVHKSQERTPWVTCTVQSAGGAGRGVDESPFKAAEMFLKKQEELTGLLLASQAQRERARAVTDAIRKAASAAAPSGGARALGAVAAQGLQGGGGGWGRPQDSPPAGPSGHGDYGGGFWEAGGGGPGVSAPGGGGGGAAAAPGAGAALGVKW